MSEESKIPERWRNIAAKVEHLLEGDEISVEVEGGFIRSRAPVDGMVVYGRNGDHLFLPGELLAPEEEPRVEHLACVVEGCDSKPLIGGICSGCYDFVCGVSSSAADNSRARKNARAAAARRK